AGVDQPMATFNSSPTTGLLDTTVNHRFFAVTDVPDAATQSPPYTWNITFTATSAAISTYQQSLSTVTSVIGGACGAPTPTPTATPSPTPTPTASVPPQPPASCTPGYGSATPTAPGG